MHCCFVCYRITANFNHNGCPRKAGEHFCFYVLLFTQYEAQESKCRKLPNEVAVWAEKDEVRSADYEDM